MSTVTKQCFSCGQGFDVNNNPVGFAIAAGNCLGGHKGPFPPIANATQQQQVQSQRINFVPGRSDISASRLSSSDGLAHIALPFGPRTFWPERRFITEILADVKSQDYINRNFSTFRQVALPFSLKCESYPEEDYCRSTLDRLMDMIWTDLNKALSSTLRTNVKIVSGEQFSGMLRFYCAAKSSAPEPVLLFETERYTLGLIASESKAVSASLYTSMCQAVQMASECALNIFKLQLLEYDEIVIPYITSAGFSIQFGAVYLMADCFPCAVTLSEQLSVTDPAHMIVIHKWVKALSNHCSRMITTVNSSANQFKQKIMDDRIFLKEKCVLKPISDMDSKYARSTMNYVLLVFYRLWHNNIEARRYVHFPIGIMGYPNREPLKTFVNQKCAWLGQASKRGYDYYQPQQNSPGYPILVYDLLEEDWILAVHLKQYVEVNRNDVINKFLAQVQNAINAITSAGVIHLDLRLNNILYRTNTSARESISEANEVEVEIRIIDWDDCMLEGDTVDMLLFENMQNDNRYPQGEKFKIACREYHDHFYQRIEEELAPPCVDHEGHGEEAKSYEAEKHEEDKQPPHKKARRSGKKKKKKKKKDKKH